jgi:hypothetical protein
MKRWLDDDAVAPELRRLLEASRGSTALPQALLARSRRRVAELTVVPAAAGAFFWLQQFAIGAGLGTALSVGIAAADGRFTLSDPSNPARAVETARPRSVQRKDIRALEPPPPASAPPVPTTTSEVPMPLSAHAQTSAAAHSPEPVAAEVALLEQARLALSTDPLRALALLDEHTRRFPHGTLGVEREVLAVDALVHAGRRSEADARATRLRAAAPGNLYEQRLERILGERQ